MIEVACDPLPGGIEPDTAGGGKVTALFYIFVRWAILQRRQ
jgi:hypothetical protein